MAVKMRATGSGETIPNLLKRIIILPARQFGGHETILSPAKILSAPKTEPISRGLLQGDAQVE